MDEVVSLDLQVQCIPAKVGCAGDFHTRVVGEVNDFRFVDNRSGNQHLDCNYQENDRHKEDDLSAGQS